MAIAIVTDSTCDLKPELVAQYGISLVRQHILWGTENYLDGIDLSINEFYQRLNEAEDLPRTSQPSPGDFATGFRAAREATGADEVVCITLSADVSGTHNSAVQAVELVDFPVHIIDARTASLPLGFLVLEAAEARDKGLSAEGVVATVKASLSKVQIYFTVSTLEYLHRGGRIGGARRLIGDTLNIKPILYVQEGAIAAKESVRTRSRVIKRMIDLVAEAQHGQVLKRVGVVHGMALEEAEELAAILKSRFNLEDVYLTNCAAAIGVHVGPSVLGVAYQLT
ncbi:MAG: DegV family protein [Anaerolineales bacterium]|nr:DegV family protein [Anaerolineales bacterium]